MEESVQKANDFLIHARNQDGGWGYTAGSGQSAPEPSCYSCLALAASSIQPAQRGLSWLESTIEADGGVHYAEDEEIHWTTSLAVFTLARLRPDSPKLPSSTACLIGLKGSADKAVGWAWTNQTYSWVEPTSHAILALKAAGQRRHPRVAEAERMLRSRTCATGGWNQGMVTALHQQFGALPMQTALAILALQDSAESRPAAVKAAAVLRAHVSAHQSALSLAWAVLALHTIGEETGSLHVELSKRQEPDGSWRGAVVLTSLAILALKAAEEGRNAFKL